MDDATTEPPQSFEALKRRLIEIEPQLPKRLRQAAGYALEHPDDFALGTASAIASSAHVQASTLVRFAQSIGFSGFSGVSFMVGIWSGRGGEGRAGRHRYPRREGTRSWRL